MDKKFKKSNIYLTLTIILVIGVIYFRDILNYEIDKYLLVFIYGAFFLLFPIKQSMYLLSFSIPLMAGLPGNIIIFILLVVYVMKRYKKIRFNHLIVLILGISIIEIINLIEFQGDIVSALNLVISILLLIIINTDKNDLDSYKIIDMFILGMVILSIFVVVLSLRDTSLINLITLRSRLGSTRLIVDSESMQLSLNPNVYGVFLNFTIGLIYIVLTVPKKTRIHYYILFIVFLLLGILTMSRSFIITFTIISLLFIYSFGLRNLKPFLKYMVIIFIMTIPFYIFFQTELHLIINNALMRFQTEDISNNRIVIFLQYNRAFFSHIRFLFLGAGFSNYSLTYNIPINFVSHNAFQEIYLSWGIIGFALFITIIISLYKKRINKSNNSLLISLPLIVIIITSMSGQLFNSGKLYLLMLSLMIVEFSKTRSSKIEKRNSVTN